MRYDPRLDSTVADCRSRGWRWRYSISVDDLTIADQHLPSFTEDDCKVDARRPQSAQCDFDDDVRRSTPPDDDLPVNCDDVTVTELLLGTNDGGDPDRSTADGDDTICCSTSVNPKLNGDVSTEAG